MHAIRTSLGILVALGLIAVVVGDIILRRSGLRPNDQ